MKTRWDKTLVSQPQWDGNRLIFTIKTEGKRIPCAISRSALHKVSGHTHLATRDLLHRFMGSRERIEEIAARIFHITPEWVSGAVCISADDIDNPPPPVRAFAREVVPFALGGAVVADSRAFQASGRYQMTLCSWGRGIARGRRSTQRTTATMGARQLILPWVGVSANAGLGSLRRSR
jgi:hypothetical protein